LSGYPLCGSRLAKRPVDKRRDPNRWGPAVASIIGEHESYLAAIKEASEREIGLTGVTLETRDRVRVRGENNFYCQLFYLQADLAVEKLKLNAKEVQIMEWKNKEEVQKMYQENPQFFVQSFGDYLAVFSR